MSDTAVRAAIAELRSIRSTDPCAAVALSTVRTTILTLETRWLLSGAARSEQVGGWEPVERRSTRQPGQTVRRGEPQGGVR